jgi:uncharacterized protein (DUF58 family)
VTDAADRPLLLDEAFLHRLERLALRTRRVGRAVGARPGARRVPAADFIDHRPYSPGDDRRHIDWPAVARHDEVHVKIGRVTHAADVHVALDNSPSMAIGAHKRRAALELAAALAWMSLAHGDRVTVLPFPSDADVWGPAAGGRLGASVLRHLSSLRPGVTPSTRLEPVVRGVAQRARVGGLLVVISDLWVADDFDMALAAVPPPRWDVLVLHMLSAEEREPTVDGATELIDAESGERVSIAVDDDVRAAYRAALHRRVDRLRSMVGGRGAAYALVPTEWPLERAVVPYLQRRSLLVD